MERTFVKDLNGGKEVLLKGWVYEIRALSKMAFILLRDISGMVQCVITNSELMKKISELSLESVIEIKGKIKEANVKAEFARHDVEIEVNSLEIISKAEKLPIHVNEKTTTTELQHRLDWRSLNLRTQKAHAIFKVQSKIIEGMQDYLNKNGFQQVFTPCLMGVASESGSEVFEVKYFDKKAYLRQDPQLHRQLTILGGIEKIYD